jgi:hypothetical protein
MAAWCVRSISDSQGVLMSIPVEYQRHYVVPDNFGTDCFLSIQKTGQFVRALLMSNVVTLLVVNTCTLEADIHNREAPHCVRVVSIVVA